MSQKSKAAISQQTPSNYFIFSTNKSTIKAVILTWITQQKYVYHLLDILILLTR
jgi:hypothetical protein